MGADIYSECMISTATVKNIPLEGARKRVIAQLLDVLAN